MLGRRTCVWFRLLYSVLILVGLLITSRYVEQTRFEVLGPLNPATLLVFDHFYGTTFTTPLPQPPSDAMIIPPRSY